MAADEADLGGFLEAAGRSLVDAQGALSGDLVDIPAGVAISEAELEIKAALDRRAAGGVVLQPISAADLRQGGIAPGLVSTLRIRYVAVTADTVVAPSAQPTRTPKNVIDAVRRRDDVSVLERILGGLAFEAVFVPATKRWVVTARDPEQRLVREVLVPDEKR